MSGPRSFADAMNDVLDDVQKEHLYRLDKGLPIPETRTLFKKVFQGFERTIDALEEAGKSFPNGEWSGRFRITIEYQDLYDCEK